MSCIICLGNRLVAEDAAGPAVFDKLLQINLPREIEVIEGGTAGLNLLPLLERRGRLVLVDAVSGFTSNGDIIVLDQSEITQTLTTPQFGHDIGLPYLLSLLPEVCSGVMPEEIIVIGLEGVCDAETVERAAELSVSIAINGVEEK